MTSEILVCVVFRSCPLLPCTTFLDVLTYICDIILLVVVGCNVKDNNIVF